MKKIAIVVEGQSEQLFVVALIEALAKGSRFHIESKRIGGGSSCAFYEMKIDDRGTSQDPDIYFLILDCSNDGRVLSYLLEQYNGFIASSFSEIIGLRDLFPYSMDKLERLQESIARELPNEPVAPLFIIAVMEFEAWLIAEHTHFPRTDERLTSAFILERLGVNVEADAEVLGHPAETLNAIYALVGKEYDKRKATVQQVLEKIDFEAYPAGALARALRLTPLYERLSNIFSSNEVAATA